VSITTPDPANALHQLGEKISAISQLPVSEHVAAYEEIHGDLQRALSEIEGL
jgi:hypothetical protein